MTDKFFCEPCQAMRTAIKRDFKALQSFCEACNTPTPNSVLVDSYKPLEGFCEPCRAPDPIDFDARKLIPFCPPCETEEERIKERECYVERIEEYDFASVLTDLSNKKDKFKEPCDYTKEVSIEHAQLIWKDYLNV